MSKNNPGIFRRLWRTLRRPTARYSLLTLLLVGFTCGIIFWGGFNTAMEATNTLAFCTSCHEMQENLKEYKLTIHYKNGSGVRAKCSDCHVPRAWGPELIHKIEATHQVWGKITGVINTPAKFEAHRMELATRVWAWMKSTNSQACRNCHSYQAMSAEAQEPTKYNKHMEAEAAGETCIDCHKGIAHHLPKEYHDPDED